ncbi:MAG: acyltransferase family protein [Halieaceae bacterium]|jgi:1-acyl-sn-glycerol-3-phosphate acyltransferase|nr:acyltransferase family protein [Halieaceae bacterium]
MAQFDKDNQPFDEDGIARHIESALAVTEPGGLMLNISYQLVKRMFNPMLVGTDNIPDRPCLFVGNHSLFALDGLVLAPPLYQEQGRFLRGLGDKFLWTPATEQKLLDQGAVIGHPDVCAALMEDGRDLLVFPGGAHEAAKSTDQMYTLMWKQRYGFVRLAATHGYTIMPMGLVGPDEFYGHLMEGHELPNSPLGGILKRLGLLTDDTRTDMLPPIPMGLLGSLLPKPQRCYIGFGEPVDLAALKGKNLTKNKLTAIREQVAEQIDTQISEMLRVREQQRGEDGLLRRILTF